MNDLSSQTLYTVTGTLWGRAHKSTGLTLQQAQRIMRDLKDWGAEDAHMTWDNAPAFNSDIEAMREKSRRVATVVAGFALAILVFVYFCGLMCWVAEKLIPSQAPYSISEVTGEPIR